MPEHSHAHGSTTKGRVAPGPAPGGGSGALGAALRLPESLLSAGAGLRLAVAGCAVALLWLGVAWAL